MQILSRVSFSLVAASMMVAACETPNTSNNSAGNSAGNSAQPGSAGHAGSSGGSGRGGGAGGASGASDGGGLSLADPRRWKTVEQAEFLRPHCEMRQASAPDIPHLSWEAQEGGREFADVLLGQSKIAAYASLSTEEHEGNAEAFATFQWLTEEGGKDHISAPVFRLSDGVPIAALQSVTDSNAGWMPCIMITGYESALSYAVFGGDKDEESRETSVSVGASGEIAWAAPAKLRSELPSAGMLFDIEDGRVVSVGHGQVTLMKSVTENTWDVLETESWSHRGAGQGDLAVWTDYEEPPSVRGWMPDGAGVRTLLPSVPSQLCGVVPTPDALVGLSAGEAALQCSGKSGDHVIWWAPRQGAESISESYRVPGTEGLYRILKAWGSHAAIALFDDELAPSAAALIVVRRGDGAAWRVTASSAQTRIDANAWTITDTHIIFAESEVATPSLTKRLVRISLDQLDAAAPRL